MQRTIFHPMDCIEVLFMALDLTLLRAHSVSTLRVLWLPLLASPTTDTLRKVSVPCSINMMEIHP
jgi:hypothetical protein